jgi:hypothetical protein
MPSKKVYSELFSELENFEIFLKNPEIFLKKGKLSKSVWVKARKLKIEHDLPIEV